MPATVEAQRVFDAIDAVQNKPDATTFQALRTKLTTLIGSRCFDALPNLAVKSDLRDHCAIVQPRLYDSAMVTQITLNVESGGKSFAVNRRLGGAHERHGVPAVARYARPWGQNQPEGDRPARLLVCRICVRG